MESAELMKYLKQTQDYIEFSFYRNSSEIMESVMKNGIDKVLSLSSLEEQKKGIFKCLSTWNVDSKTSYSKSITIDISGEMIYLTEILDNSNACNVTVQSTISNTQVDKGNDSSSAPLEIDIQKEYGEILDLLKSKPLSSTEKSILTKVVSAFFK